MWVAITAMSAMVTLLVVVFNVFEDEEGNAKSMMVYRKSSCIQDTTGVLRGSINQQVIGVMIETSGRGEPLKLNSISFNTGGMQDIALRCVENARLWSTGNDPDFSLQQSIGSSIASISGKPLKFSVAHALLPGKNYFWLTVDVKIEAMPAPAFVDASCEEIRVGALAYVPAQGDPIGKRFIQANVPYYSMGNYSLNKTSSWNSRRDGTGIPPRSLKESRNSYFIQSGHRMISSTGSTLQTLVVEKGGELKITAPLRLSAMYVAYGGTVLNDTAVTDYYCFNDFHLDNGAVYLHNNKGPLPARYCFFKPSSRQVVFDWGESTFRKDIAFGDLTLDIERGVPLNLGARLRRVQGELELRRTGGDQAGVFFSGNDTLEIGGSLVVDGGKILGVETGRFRIHIGGDLVVKAGSFYDSFGILTGQGMQLHVDGDVMLMGGYFNSSVSPGSCMAFSGSGTTRWIQKPQCRVLIGNSVIRENHVIELQTELLGPLAGNRELAVDRDGELLCGKALITGPGAFHLRENGFLGIGHPEGIFSSGELGNIRTAHRFFHSGATYYYYTDSSPQQTGVFSTYPDKQSVRRLVVNKGNSTQFLNLSQDFNIDDRCMVSIGDLRNNGFELRLNEDRGIGVN